MLDTRIDDLELSARSHNCLIHRLGCVTVRDFIDLLSVDAFRVVKTPNFGRKSWNEIRDKLEEIGIRLPRHLTMSAAIKTRERTAPQKPYREPGTSVYLLQSEIAALVALSPSEAILGKLTTALPKVR